MTGLKGFDWPALMRVGLKDLALTPDVFWSLSPAELRLILGEEAAAMPLLSDGLAALMTSYPDKTKE